MTRVEYDLDFIDSNHHIFGASPFDMPEQLLSEVSLQDQQLGQKATGSYIGVLASLHRNPDNTVETVWATGYGAHNNIVKYLTNNPDAGESTVSLEIPTSEGALQIGGACMLTSPSGNASLYLGGNYLARNPETGLVEEVALAGEAKLLVRDISLATGLAAMKLCSQRPFYLEARYCFEYPGRSFTESGTITIDDRI